MNNIQPISNALLCSNCGACKAICPVNAISFQTSSIGRMYAIINENCIECKACTKVCPSLDSFNLHTVYNDKYIGNILHVYSGKSTNKELFRNSQSGGACTAVISYLFKHKLIDAAIVCKMYPGNPPINKAIVINNIDDLLYCQKSCYTPVDMLSALCNTENKQSVALVGLPCHIQGAVNLMKQSRKFRNITYKLGLICDRTLGETLKDVMISYLPKGSKCSIFWRKKVVYTDDDRGYNYINAPVVLESKSQKIILPNTYRFALKDYFTLPRCKVCYDKLNTHADIVFGDPWGMTNVNWEKGENVILVRTPKGEELIYQMYNSGELKLEQKDIIEVIKGQHIAERKKTVTAYAKAIRTLHENCESYLCKQEDANVEDKNILDAQKTLRIFIENEKLTKSQIITQAKLTIHKYILQQRFRTSLLFKVLSHIKRIIKR